MHATLTMTHTTTTIRDVIQWVSFAGSDIFVQEFYALGMEYYMYEDTIVLLCADGTCQFTVRHHFVDATSLLVSK